MATRLDRPALRLMSPERVQRSQEYSSRWALRLRRLGLVSMLVLVTLFVAVVTLSASRTARQTVDRLQSASSVGPAAATAEVPPQ